jgi:3-hydroxymyristoyl/3-hydroxydecanoyl-(acyl carrier protein) dehydratase
MAILWCYEEKGMASLPSFSETYRQYSEFPANGVKAVMEVNEINDKKMKSSFTFLNSSNEVIATIAGYEAVMDKSLIKNFRTKNTKKDLFSREQLLAYAIGNPSEAFGEQYKRFDTEMIIARLPGPPYFFMDRVCKADHKAWELKPGGWIEAEYDIPEKEWYFEANRTSTIPFCVLLEIALQPCGWLAAYAGSALKSKDQLKFRNLGGKAVLIREIEADSGSLTMKCRMKKVSEAAGMIIEDFDIQVWQNNEIVYDGETNFGFFTNATMKNQVGVGNPEKIIYRPDAKEIESSTSHVFTDESPLTPDDLSGKFSTNASMPSKALRMIDEIEQYIPNGGPEKLGYIKGVKKVDPSEWFFKAHFYQDPVCPGSLGVESFIQLIKFAALKKWGDLKETHKIEFISKKEHTWIYRGQIIPENKTIEVSAYITEIKEGDEPEMIANGYLQVDGLLIYEMKNFGVKLVRR